MRSLLAVSLVAFAFAACGSGASLSGDERLAVATARVSVAQLVLDGSGYGKTLDDVDAMVALYRAKPDAAYDGLTMRQVLQDMASDLDEYQPRLSARIDRALR